MVGRSQHRNRDQSAGGDLTVEVRRTRYEPGPWNKYVRAAKHQPPQADDEGTENMCITVSRPHRQRVLSATSRGGGPLSVSTVTAQGSWTLNASDNFVTTSNAEPMVDPPRRRSRHAPRRGERVERGHAAEGEVNGDAKRT